MAGLSQLSYNHSNASPRQYPLHQLVSREVRINGERFTTMVPDGTNVDFILDNVARENGGGVARLYYPEMKAYEIVAIQIGNHLIVKDDPKKVEAADFSKFANPEAAKSLMIRASHHSRGGAHVFFGEDGRGVPITKGTEDLVAFPNTEELLLQGGRHTITVSQVDYSANPNSVRDLQEMYSEKGGLRISHRAMELLGTDGMSQERVERSHGGFRSEKLMLPSTKVATLNIDTGEVTAMSEVPMNSISVQNADVQPTVMPLKSEDHRLTVSIAYPQASDLGPMRIAFDGSIGRLPYLYVKVFDGKLEDQLSISAPLQDCKVASVIKQPPPQRETPSMPRLHYFHQEEKTYGPKNEKQEQRPSVSSGITNIPPLPKIRESNTKQKKIIPSKPQHSQNLRLEKPLSIVLPEEFKHPRTIPLNMPFDIQTRVVLQTDPPKPTKSKKIKKLLPQGSVAKKSKKKPDVKLQRLPLKKESKEKQRLPPKLGVKKKEIRKTLRSRPEKRIESIKNEKAPEKKRKSRKDTWKPAKTIESVAIKKPKISRLEAKERSTVKIQPIYRRPLRITRHFFHQLIGLFAAKKGQWKSKGRKLIIKNSRAV